MSIDRKNIIIDAIAFEGDEQGFHFKATYLKEPKGEALIEISKDSQTVKEFLFPGYKVWNIAAHASDIIRDLVQGGNSYGGGL